MATNNGTRLRSVISANLGVTAEQVTDGPSPHNTDTWDSPDHINVISALEQEFGVTLSTESLADTRTVPKLKAL